MSYVATIRRTRGICVDRSTATSAKTVPHECMLSRECPSSGSAESIASVSDPCQYPGPVRSPLSAPPYRIGARAEILRAAANKCTAIEKNLYDRLRRRTICAVSRRRHSVTNLVVALYNSVRLRIALRPSESIRRLGIQSRSAINCQLLCLVVHTHCHVDGMCSALRGLACSLRGRRSRNAAGNLCGEHSRGLHKRRRET